MVATSESELVMCVSSILVITSPVSSPADPAAEPSLISSICAPSVTSAPEPACAATSATVMPSRAWVGVSPFFIWSMIGSTSSIGIANPRPIEPASPPRPEPVLRMEELMPTSWPDMFTSGPPLLPGLIAASVWIAG
jgi:hypothetical protein